MFQVQIQPYVPVTVPLQWMPMLPLDAARSRLGPTLLPQAQPLLDNEQAMATVTLLTQMLATLVSGLMNPPAAEQAQQAQEASQTPVTGTAPSPTPLSTGKSVPPAPVAASSNLQNTKAWEPTEAPQKSDASNRSAQTYNSVIDQFDVENNPRYAPRDGNTYCNIFLWDVTRAMGAEIPHYWKGRELDANATADWLRENGREYGWSPIGEREAQAAANQGKPVVVAWKNAGGIGHVGVVRPGEANGNGPALAQAGARNLNHAHVRDTFGQADVAYYVHA